MHLGRNYAFEHTNTNYIFKWMIYGSVGNLGVDFEYLPGGWPINYPLPHCENGVLAIDTSFVISFETCLFIDTKSCLYARHVQR